MPLLCWVCCLLVLPIPQQALCWWVVMFFLFSHVLMWRRSNQLPGTQIERLQFFCALSVTIPSWGLSSLPAVKEFFLNETDLLWSSNDRAARGQRCLSTWWSGSRFRAAPLLTVHIPSPASSPGLCCQTGFHLFDHRFSPPALRSSPASVNPAFGPSAVVSLHVGSSRSIAKLDSVPKPCTSLPMVASGTAVWCRDSQGYSRAG